MDVDGDDEVAAVSGASPRTWTEDLLQFLERKQSATSIQDREVVVIDDSSEDELGCGVDDDAMDVEVLDEGWKTSAMNKALLEEETMSGNITIEGATELIGTLASRLHSSSLPLRVIASKDVLDSEDLNSLDEEKMDRDLYALLIVILEIKKWWPDIFTANSIIELEEIRRLLGSADDCRENSATDNKDDIISDILSKGCGCQLGRANAVTEIVPFRGLSNQIKDNAVDMIELLGREKKRQEETCMDTSFLPHPFQETQLRLEDGVDCGKQENGEDSGERLNTKAITSINLTGAAENVASKGTSTTYIPSPSVGMIEDSKMPGDLLGLEQKNIASGDHITTTEVKEPQRPGQTSSWNNVRPSQIEECDPCHSLPSNIVVQNHNSLVLEQARSSRAFPLDSQKGIKYGALKNTVRADTGFISHAATKTRNKKSPRFAGGCAATERVIENVDKMLITRYSDDQSSVSTCTNDPDCVTSLGSPWGDIDHQLDGFDDLQKVAIKKERMKRIEEQNKMFAVRKLSLVLDLDHTLLNSVMFDEVDPSHETRLREWEENDWDNPRRYLFRIQHLRMWTKLRPGIWNFLEKASKFYELHIYTMGTKAYATEMAKVLDPTGNLFAGRVIARGVDPDCLDFNERMPKSKDLDGVLGMESAVVIIDDTARVWPNHKYNLINVERYMYFPCSRRQFGVSGPSHLECECDERTSDGTLASLLAVIVRTHCEFFSHSKLHEADVRTILAWQRRKVLAGCIILFSGIIPVEEKNPRRHPTWRTAENFGAICTNQIDDQVTHVVAKLSRTEKVKWALKNKRLVVSPAWVEASALLYRRADECQFPVREKHGSNGR